ncbi:MAG: response regulator transcription factor [Anaerolineales bacterium]|nr:response regulator transcription factor [Anaerolineales bacterium]MCS7247297.1 response regulator transcription factor [Anaerolineales bacterium]MDW8161108.1 response regulator transcription factor [Anaerolineales bacterium]MDW8446259.1 response regulator transcription factor [Anaerolineales bacterium]
MTTKILIVDDEPRYLRLMEANLITEGYTVLKAMNGQEAVDKVAKEQPDLVLLDIMMPILDGFAATERIREFSNVPIIVVTARGEESARVRGLDLGADDYIVKPFSATELVARVRAVLRRAKPTSTTQQAVFYHGNLKIDFAKAEVYRNDRLVFLSATEYRLLLQFAHNVGQVLTSEELLTSVWGPEYREDKEILWVSISRLRQKLEDDPKNPVHIVTRSGMGYLMPVLEESQ